MMKNIVICRMIIAVCLMPATHAHAQRGAKHQAPPAPKPAGTTSPKSSTHKKQGTPPSKSATQKRQGPTPASKSADQKTTDAAPSGPTQALQWAQHQETAAKAEPPIAEAVPQDANKAWSFNQVAPVPHVPPAPHHPPALHHPPVLHHPPGVSHVPQTAIAPVSVPVPVQVPEPVGVPVPVQTMPKMKLPQRGTSQTVDVADGMNSANSDMPDVTGLLSKLGGLLKKVMPFMGIISLVVGALAVRRVLKLFIG
jgi:hypothetical protein